MIWENIEALIIVAYYIDLAVPPWLPNGHVTESDIVKLINGIILETKLLIFLYLREIKEENNILIVSDIYKALIVSKLL